MSSASATNWEHEVSTTDRVAAVLDQAAKAHNAALAAVITRAQTLTDDDAEVLHMHLQSTSEFARTEARRVIDYAALDQSATTGQQDLISQIAEAADAGWYAAGEASGEAANVAKAAGKWSPLGDSAIDRHWMKIWGSAWQAVSDAARTQAATGILEDGAVAPRHYDILNTPWQAMTGRG